VELKPGDEAPAFSLPDEDGKVVSNKDLKGKRYVVYFYPKDDTPGCTTEACQFTDNFPQFEMLGVPVLGVSRDDAAAHQAFRKKYGLRVRRRVGRAARTRRGRDPLDLPYRLRRAGREVVVLRETRRPRA